MLICRRVCCSDQLLRGLMSPLGMEGWLGDICFRVEWWDLGCLRSC